MKTVRLVLGSIVIMVGIGCLVLAFLSFRDTDASVIRKAMTDQKELYNAGNYPAAFNVSKLLVDSFKVEQAPVRLNYANAGYLSALRDSARSLNFNSGDTATADAKKFFNYMDVALQTTKDLAERSAESSVASIGYNHMGVILCRKLSQDEPEEKVLTEALGYFRDALQKDDENEFARYNYELVQKKLLYPELVIAQVKSLINQRKYRQARQVLQRALRHDNRVNKNYGDFVNRIDNIIKIDSLSRS